MKNLRGSFLWVTFLGEQESNNIKTKKNGALGKVESGLCLRHARELHSQPPTHFFST